MAGKLSLSDLLNGASDGPSMMGFAQSSQAAYGAPASSYANGQTPAAAQWTPDTFMQAVQSPVRSQISSPQDAAKFGIVPPNAGQPVPGVGTQGTSPVDWKTNYAPFGGVSPWQPNVMAGTVDQQGNPASPVNFSSPTNPNTNYITPDAAQQIGARFGLQAVPQDMSGPHGPAGLPYVPGGGRAEMWQLQTSGGPNTTPYSRSNSDNVDAGAVAKMLADGVPDWLIQARLGLAPDPYRR